MGFLNPVVLCYFFFSSHSLAIHALIIFLIYIAIQRGLPNIATYLRIVLKREKLSEEAESLRSRYDAILASLEQGVFPSSFGRRQSFSTEDDGGYFSGNRPRSTYPLFSLPSSLPPPSLFSPHLLSFSFVPLNSPLSQPLLTSTTLHSHS